MVFGFRRECVRDSIGVTARSPTRRIHSFPMVVTARQTGIADVSDAEGGAGGWLRCHRSNRYVVQSQLHSNRPNG